ncbi:MAG: DUF2236 domain-containing protein [Micrococcales bacterium]|nr:DUF2236 domain-containing protein [Micrococcales bacterium]
MLHPRRYRDWAADGVLVLAGGAAILLQLLDPVVAASVARHSRFARDPVGRLTGTLRYVYSVALEADAARDAATTVTRAHRGIPGADDPQRQLWVAGTLYWAGSRAHEAIYGPLEPRLADEVYARSSRLGSALGMPPGLWLRDRAAFEAWWADAVATPAVTPDARRVAAQLMRPRGGPLWLRAAMPLGRLLTAGLLPPAVRAAYGQNWTPALERRYRRTLRGIRLVWRLTPRALRELPARRLAR